MARTASWLAKMAWSPAAFKQALSKGDAQRISPTALHTTAINDILALHEHVAQVFACTQPIVHPAEKRLGFMVIHGLKKGQKHQTWTALLENLRSRCGAQVGLKNKSSLLCGSCL